METIPSSAAPPENVSFLETAAAAMRSPFSRIAARWAPRATKVTSIPDFKIDAPKGSAYPDDGNAHPILLISS